MAMRTLLVLLGSGLLLPSCTSRQGTDSGTGTDAPALDAGGHDAPLVDGGGRDARPPVDAPGRDVRGPDVPVRDTPMMCPDEELAMREGSPVVSGSTAGATARVTADCAGAAPSLARFYSWTAPRTATFLIHTIGSSFDTALVLRDMSCTGPELQCDDDGGGSLTSLIALDATAGHAYVIVVTGYDSTESGAFDLSIQEGVASEVGLCTNGMDDDLDGDVDCLDFDCEADPLCVEICTDGMDNDGDSDIDCFDFDCDTDPACLEICTDGMDNDGNGDIDCRDLDCARDPACPEDCGNGLDDDMDGDVDCADLACDADPRCVETNCTNGLDDDMDGDADCLDFDCDLDPACGGIGPASCVGVFCIRGRECLDCGDVPMCVPIGTGCP